MRTACPTATKNSFACDRSRTVVFSVKIWYNKVTTANGGDFVNIWDIILIFLMITAILYFVVFSVISRVKAKKAGIIRVKFPANTARFVCMAVCAVLNVMLIIGTTGECAEYKNKMDDLQRLGFVEFHKEYYNFIVTSNSSKDEQYATEKMLSEYREKYDQKRHMIESRVLLAVLFALSALFNGAYITQRGVFMFGDIKPKNTAAVIEDGMLCFRSKGKHEYTMLKLPASEENLRLYSEFIVENNVEPIARLEQI